MTRSASIVSLVLDSGLVPGVYDIYIQFSFLFSFFCLLELKVSTRLTHSILIIISAIVIIIIPGGLYVLYLLNG